MTTLMVHVILGDVLIAAPGITACDGLDHPRQDLNGVRLCHFRNGDRGDTGLVRRAHDRLPAARRGSWASRFADAEIRSLDT